MADDITIRHGEVLNIWTVYNRPRDYPHSFVARRFEVGNGGTTLRTNDMFIADTLAEIRALLPPGLVCLPPFENDDPVICEVWL